MAIEGFGSDLGLDLRGALNPLTATTRKAFADAPEGSVASELRLGRGISEAEAYALLVAQDLAPARLTRPELIAALSANIKDGKVAGIPVATLNDPATRDAAYTALEAAGTVPTAATDDEVAAGATGYAAENEDVSDVVKPGVISNSVAEADADGFVETASTIVALSHERLDLDELLGKFHFWRERKAGQRGEAGTGLLGEKLHATAEVTRPFVDRAVFAEVGRGESEFVQPWTDRAGGIDVTKPYLLSRNETHRAASPCPLVDVFRSGQAIARTYPSRIPKFVASPID